MSRVLDGRNVEMALSAEAYSVESSRPGRAGECESSFGSAVLI